MMGSSTFVLFKKNCSISAEDLLNFFKKFFLKENLIFNYDNEKYINNKLKYVQMGVSDKPFDEDYDRQMLFELYDEPYDFRLHELSWENNGQEYFQAIIVDYFENNEDLLFKIMLAVLLEYPQAKLWMEEDWCYTLKDLKKIEKNKPFDMDWCYKNPKDFL